MTVTIGIFEKTTRNQYRCWLPNRISPLKKCMELERPARTAA
ncbi:hypothetical protein PAAL109150_15845 [Paenibacillus alkaliterrae]